MSRVWPNKDIITFWERSGSHSGHNKNPKVLKTSPGRGLPCKSAKYG